MSKRPNFRDDCPDRPLLLPPDLKDWLPEEHPDHDTIALFRQMHLEENCPGYFCRFFVCAGRRGR